MVSYFKIFDKSVSIFANHKRYPMSTTFNNTQTFYKQLYSRCEFFYTNSEVCLQVREITTFLKLG